VLPKPDGSVVPLVGDVGVTDVYELDGDGIEPAVVCVV
jgi:hypothetical protein